MIVGCRACSVKARSDRRSEEWLKGFTWSCRIYYTFVERIVINFTTLALFLLAFFLHGLISVKTLVPPTSHTVPICTTNFTHCTDLLSMNSVIVIVKHSNLPASFFFHVSKTTGMMIITSKGQTMLRITVPRIVPTTVPCLLPLETEIS